MATRTHALESGEILSANGYFRGDIGLNDSDLALTLLSKEQKHLVQLKVEPFTKNCGIKAISRVCVWDDPKHWEIIESFLFHVCRAGIIIGSDHTNGNTFNHVKKLSGFEIDSKPVWNPVYTWSKGHKIVIFRKNLFFKPDTNIWPDWKADNA